MTTSATPIEQSTATQSTLRSRISYVLSCAVLVGGITTVLVAAHLVVVSYSSLPHWDIWDTELDFAVHGGSQDRAHWLWKQENQHRLVIPKLFLLADLRWFHATQTFLLVSIFVIQLLHLALLSWSVRALGGWRGTLWRVATGLAAFCLFCPSQWENFVWGFQTCFVMPPLFCTVSAVGLLLYWRSSAAGRSVLAYLVLTIAAALGATYSLSNGNLLWPLLVGAALMLRLDRRALLSLIGSGTLSTVVYLHHYTRPRGIISALQSPLQLLSYITAYFGSCWISFPGVSPFPSAPGVLTAAEFIGSLGLVVSIALLLRIPHYIRRAQAFPLQLELMLLFCVGTGIITAVGRRGFGTVQSFSSHYQTIALLFWWCMALLLLHELLSSTAKLGSDALVFAEGAFLCIMLAAAFFAARPIRRARVRGLNLNVAAAALITGVPDQAQLAWAYPPRPNYVLSFVPTLRAERLSAFSDVRASLLGQRLESVFTPVPASRCSGRVETVNAVSDAVSPSIRITGWAWDFERNRMPAEIVASTDGIITGIGAVGAFRPDVPHAHPEVSSNYSGFRGYSRDVYDRRRTGIYAILDRSTRVACFLGTADGLEFLPN